VIEQEKDPVCGASVNPSSGVHESVGSNVYTFCSDECRRNSCQSGPVPRLTPIALPLDWRRQKR